MKIGQTVTYFAHAAIVTWVWSDDCVDIVYWDRASCAWISVFSACRGQWKPV